MPLNKSALIRYQTLDKCFSDPHRRYHLDDLMDACQEALSKFYHSKETVSRRSIFYDISFMKSEEGYAAPIEKFSEGKRIYYRYSNAAYTISRQPLNEHETIQLKEAFVLLSRLSGRHEFGMINDLLPRIKQFLEIEAGTPIISYEENKDLKNGELLGELLNAIRDQRVLTVHYQSFNATKPEVLTLHPYFLKQYNLRWFIFGFCPELMEKRGIHPANIALDRIKNLKYSDKSYVPNTNIDFEAYFDDIIGVTKPAGNPIQKIILKVSKNKKPYIETKPLHMSQKRLKPTEDGYITSIEVIPNYELYALLLSLGADVEVIAPLEVREELKKLLNGMWKKYDERSKLDH